jgi:gp16 family phage-associated protein
MGEQAKQGFYTKGMMLRQFAERHQLTYRTVSEVLRGVSRGLYGRATALRLREVIVKPLAQLVEGGASINKVAGLFVARVQVGPCFNALVPVSR